MKIEELGEEETAPEEVPTEELKTAFPDDDGEEEGKSDPPSPEEDVDPKDRALEKIIQELDQIDAVAKEGYVNEKYHYSYGEYKRGLKSCSDLVVGREARENPELKKMYMERRRKFCANAAAACIKIGYWEQGLEACSLILEEGADDEMQRRKALFRAGVCARGCGDLDAAKQFLKKLLEVQDLDKATQRDIAKQLKGISEENRRYKKFAKNIVSKEHEDSIVEPAKKAPTLKELEEMAEVEEKRKDYQERKRREDDKVERTRPTTPEITMTEEECIEALDTLAERYGDEKVQDELREAAYQHELKFSKGYIIKSRMILAPLQRDVLEKHGYLEPSSDGAWSAPEEKNDSAPEKAPDSAPKKETNKSGDFEDTLDDLVLLGEGVIEKSGVHVYSVALYSDENAKSSVFSTPKKPDEAEALATLTSALKSASRSSFLLMLKMELRPFELSGEILEIISSRITNNAALANISSLMYKADKATFPVGTTVRMDCTGSEVVFTIDGVELGSVPDLTDALFEAYLGDANVCPMLHQSLVKACCQGDESGSDEVKAEESPLEEVKAEESSSDTAKESAGGGPDSANKVHFEESSKVHFDALRKFQHTVRYLGYSNKEISEKAELCQKLSIGLLYEDSMRGTGWVSL